MDGERASAWAASTPLATAQPEAHRAEHRETVVRGLEMLALTQVLHALRNPNGPLIKEIVFEVDEE